MNSNDDNPQVSDPQNQNLGQVGSGGISDQGVEDVVVQAPSPQPPSVGAPPEHEPVSMGPATETMPVVEVREYEVPAEVQEYVEKVDKENTELQKNVVHEGQPVVQPAMSVQEPSIMLPLTQPGLAVAIKQKVTMSARWLAEWCVRIIKKFHGRVFYAPEKSQG